VNDGPASQSYGIQVAQLAGIPRPVIQLAKQKLLELENHAHSVPTQLATPQQGDLFAAYEENPAIKLLKEINPDQLSPKEALELLYKLKQNL
jgi:DNA mismatch repair protein MutS